MDEPSYSVPPVAGSATSPQATAEATSVTSVSTSTYQGNGGMPTSTNQISAAASAAAATPAASHDLKGVDDAFADDVEQAVEQAHPRGASKGTFSPRVLPTTSIATTTTMTSTLPSSSSAKPRSKEKSSASSVTSFQGDGGVSAVMTAHNGGSNNNPRVNRCFACLHVVTLLLATAGFILGLLAKLDDNKNNESSGLLGVAKDLDSSSKDSDATPAPSLLDVIAERGVLRCGMFGPAPGFTFPKPGQQQSEATEDVEYVGMDVALCRALSAAIFDGDADAFEIHFVQAQRWVELNATNVDVVFDTTHTMERDLYIAEVGTGVEFSLPYFYDGRVFSAVSEELLECAETGTFNGTCADLVICAPVGTTHLQAIEQIFPPENIRLTTRTTEVFELLPQGSCNAFVGLQLVASEAGFRTSGYTGPYFVGSERFSREPLCMVTRQGDYRWSDFVNYVLQSLIFAEEQDIRQISSDQMPLTDVFGPQFRNMFQHAVAVSGNYGEMYVSNLETFLPRTGANRLNTGDAPRLLSFPFGNLASVGPALEEVSPTIQAIKQRGFVNCGLTVGRGTNAFDAENREWNGYGTDFCRALSAALFDGVDDRILVTVVQANNQFDLLVAGDIDVQSFWTFTVRRDVKEEQTQQGLAYSQPFAATGNAFSGTPQFVECAENLDVFSPECQTLRVCVIGESASAALALKLLRNEFYIVPMEDRPAFYNGFRDGACNVLFGASTIIQRHVVLAATGLDSSVEYAEGTRLFDIDQYGLTMREDDPVWVDFVRWVTASLIYAEEQGITQTSASEMPRPQIFGPLRADSLYHAVNAVGNLGEVWDRNIGFLGRPIVAQLSSFTDPRVFSTPGFESLGAAR